MIYGVWKEPANRFAYDVLHSGPNQTFITDDINAAYRYCDYLVLHYHYNYTVREYEKTQGATL